MQYHVHAKGTKLGPYFKATTPRRYGISLKDSEWAVVDQLAEYDSGRQPKVLADLVSEALKARQIKWGGHCE